jgi:hypothetical protein
VNGRWVQKLVPVDHVDVNARIIEERAVAIEEVRNEKAANWKHEHRD